MIDHMLLATLRDPLYAEAKRRRRRAPNDGKRTREIAYIIIELYA